MRSSIFFAILAATVTSGTYTVSMTELFPYYHNPHSTPLPTVTQVPSRPVAPPSAPVPSPTTPLPKAVAVLGNGVLAAAKGNITFTQLTHLGTVKVSGIITGLNASSVHGLHIHASGDLSGGCATAGAHYNPFNRTHGDRLDQIRHVGDLGNIQADENGVSNFTFVDSYLSLSGPISIVGRAIVLHAGADDLGKGGTPDSLTTGNSGARAACGVIGLQ